MARKRRQEEHENHERWLVSYADFITLLFAFFVVMYAVSSVNEGKYKVLSDSLTNAFSNTSGKAGGQPINVIQGAPPLSPRPGCQDGALARAEKKMTGKNSNSGKK
jgi:chemotaxis protein MotB